MENVRKDLVVLCGDDKNITVGLLRDKVKLTRMEQTDANILVMFDDDQGNIFGQGVLRIPSGVEDGSRCRGLSMRTMARLDPDLIVIDEIRTPGEARAVVMLAETGHQVFTTIHSTSEDEALASWDNLTKEFKALSPEFFQSRVSINWVCEYPPEFPIVGIRQAPVLADHCRD